MKKLPVTVLILLVSCAQFTAQGSYSGLFLLQSLGAPGSAGASASGGSGGSGVVTVTQTGGGTAVTEGTGSDSYQIVLASQPSASVAIQITFDTAQLRLNGQGTTPLSLTFSTTNWNVAQNIVITAYDDTTVEGNHSSVLSHAVTSNDSAYQGASVANITVSITDNDGPGISVIETGGDTVVTEGGATDSYGLVLTSVPVSNVVLSLTFDDAQIRLNGSTSPVTVTFTTANWYIPQTITVSAVDDGLSEGNHQLTISQGYQSGDATFNVSIASVVVTVIDNDGPGVSITQSGGWTDVMENGFTDSFDVVLTSAPSAAVQLSLSFDTTQIRLNGSGTSPLNLTFAPGNWSTPQTITVSAVDDTTIEGNHQATISFTASSGDGNYNGITVPGVLVRITDNDISPITGNVQSGTQAMGGSASVDVAITAVNLSRSFALCYFMTGSSNPQTVPTCQLTSTTNLQIRTGAALSATTVSWYVVQFASGAAVQRNSLNMASGDSTSNVTITSVDTTKAFVIVYARMNDSSVGNDERRTVKARLTSSTNLEISRRESGSAIDIEWQVVELDGASVKAGQATIGSGASSVIAPVAPVNAGSSFLIFNLAADSATNGVEEEYQVRGQINDSTSITFARESSVARTVEISYFLVEMLNGTSIQRGSVAAVSSTATQFDSAIPVPVTVNRTVPFVSVSATGSGSSDLDSGSFMATLTSSTNIRLTRASSENRTAHMEWYTMEFTAE
ncbi:MAG: hypothetical protein HS115_15080 [Spirochaetales bacterium]|nr:hypothetical protein [Spirochaetales bacterium]